jgi:hypothetical protein
MPAPNPSATIVVREHRGRPFYEAKFRHEGQQVKRRIGPAWLVPIGQIGNFSKPAFIDLARNATRITKS